jgi:hypothetical protein
MAAAAKRKNDIWNTSTVEGLSLAFTSPGVKYSAEGASISRERKEEEEALLLYYTLQKQNHYRQQFSAKNNSHNHVRNYKAVDMS